MPLSPSLLIQHSSGYARGDAYAPRSDMRRKSGGACCGAASSDG